MINEIHILHECHCSDFTCHTGKEPAGLLRVVSYHHEVIVELGEYSFYTFAEPLVSPGWRTLVFLIQPIWNFNYSESDDFEVGELRDNPTSGHISEFIPQISCEILAYSKDSDEICYKVAHKQCNSS